MRMCRIGCRGVCCGPARACSRAAIAEGAEIDRDRLGPSAVGGHGRGGGLVGIGLLWGRGRLLWACGRAAGCRSRARSRGWGGAGAAGGPLESQDVAHDGLRGSTLGAGHGGIESDGCRQASCSLVMLHTKACMARAPLAFLVHPMLSLG